MIRIETNRLIIRDVEESDFDILLPIYNKKENMQFISSGRYDWNKTELIEKYQKINKDYAKGSGIFVAEEKKTKTIIGEAGLFNSHNDPKILEVGYIIDITFQKKGFGSEICTALIHYSFTKLGVKEIIARMYANNKASVHLSEKVGMNRITAGYTSDLKAYYVYSIKKKK